jgi:hypothetical protein
MNEVAAAADAMHRDACHLEMASARYSDGNSSRWMEGEQSATMAASSQWIARPGTPERGQDHDRSTLATASLYAI